ncbi:MAG TPA: FHA domain-containing protein [Prosthecobacter sp.]|nr:FHA domain-containing protein [Prosthecobacter sp.]
MAKIQYTTPEGASGEVELTADRMSLGRTDDNMLVINDASVSSHHGEVVNEGGEWILTDLGSTNGTKVGGERVDRIELTHGGSFTLGSVDCVFVGDAPAAPAPAFGADSVRTQTMSSSSSGYGSTPVDRSRRSGFGPKVKEKNPGSGLLITLGLIALAACGYAAWSFTQMSA